MASMSSLRCARSREEAVCPAVGGNQVRRVGGQGGGGADVRRGPRLASCRLLGSTTGTRAFTISHNLAAGQDGYSVRSEPAVLFGYTGGFRATIFDESSCVASTECRRLHDRLGCLSPPVRVAPSRPTPRTRFSVPPPAAGRPRITGLLAGLEHF